MPTKARGSFIKNVSTRNGHECECIWMCWNRVLARMGRMSGLTGIGMYGWGWVGVCLSGGSGGWWPTWMPLWPRHLPPGGLSRSVGVSVGPGLVCTFRCSLRYCFHLVKMWKIKNIVRVHTQQCASVAVGVGVGVGVGVFPGAPPLVSRDAPPCSFYAYFPQHILEPKHSLLNHPRGGMYIYI